jgi:cob(I)alamin adenosyltransferase
MKAAMQSMRSELDETIRHKIEKAMTNISRETYNIQTELTENFEKTKVKLQAVDVSLDTQVKKLQENLKVISIDLTMVDVEVKTTRKEALEQQRIMKEKIEADMREFHAQLEEVKTTVLRGSTPAAGASTVQPPTLNGNTTWSVFRRQFEIVAEHNRWSDREITALKGRAAAVLYGIPTSTTYEETLQALEDRFGDQHFSAAYRCRLTRNQKAGESLQDFATAIEQLAHRAYPTLPEDHIRREAGRAFAYWVKTST